MAKSDLLKDAIADAKAIREAAIANAKAALEESFTPAIKDMLRAKIEEMESEEEEIEESYDLDELNEIEEEELEEVTQSENDVVEEEVDLEEILNSLDESSDEGEPLNEEDDDSEEEMEDDSETEEETEEEESEEDEDVEINLEELTAEQLEELIKDVFEEMIEDGTLSMEMGDEPEEGEESLGDVEPMGMEPEGGEEPEEVEMELEEILSELQSFYEEDEIQDADNSRLEAEINELKSKLAQATKTIRQLNEEFNNVNLLNAKLLFTINLFKDKQLSESTKLKVIEAFDRAKTTKEAKIVYETLKENLNTRISNPKSQIRENLGMASKVTPSIKKEIVSPEFPTFGKWTKWATS